MNAKLIVCCIIGMIAIQLSSAVPDDCTLEPDSGLCRGAFPRYFYNINTGTCEIFTYGGCQGNANNFEAEEDCTKACAV